MHAFRCACYMYHFSKENLLLIVQKGIALRTVQRTNSRPQHARQDAAQQPLLAEANMQRSHKFSASKCQYKVSSTDHVVPACCSELPTFEVLIPFSSFFQR